MRSGALLLRRGMRVIVALMLLYAAFRPSIAVSGTPHVVYGKVFNEGGGSPLEGDLQTFAFILLRPGEVVSKSSVGNGYKILVDDGWVWFEMGNTINPWAVGEKLRLIVVDSLANESRAVDVVLGSSGTQLLADLHLQSGDHAGPRSYQAQVNGSNPASIPFGTSSFALTASIDDSIAGDSDIVSAEYFIDTDPGPGFGTPMQAQDAIFNSPQERVTASVSATLWTMGSSHTIYVRGKDAADNWGTTHKVVVSSELSLVADANGDGKVTMADIFYLINHLYAHGPAPIGSCDMNGDGRTNVKDLFYLIYCLCAHGSPPK